MQLGKQNPSACPASITNINLTNRIYVADGVSVLSGNVAVIDGGAFFNLPDSDKSRWESLPRHWPSHMAWCVSLTGEGRMKPRILLLFLSLLLIPLGPSAAQQSPDPKQANLVAYARFKALTPHELDGLLSKAQSGDAEAQYWAGIFYSQGKVPKHSEEGARWLLKSAEQGYAPAQRIFG
jgi:hypothetical protein